MDELYERFVKIVKEAHSRERAKMKKERMS